MQRNLDMTLTLDNDGNARMSYIDLESGDDFGYKFRFTGELGEDRNAQIFTMGAEIMSWFDMMKDRLKRSDEHE